MSHETLERATRVRRHRPWWRGGSSVQRWNAEVLSWALIGLGAGMLLGAFIGGVLGTLALWIALLVPVVLATRRGIPRGILAFRPVDLLYGIVLGMALRLTQGWLAIALGGTGALPSYASLDGRLPSLWWLTDGMSGVVVAPVIEEFFFRGVLLVAILTIVRRLTGRAGSAIGIGGVVAVVASAALFVAAHLLTSRMTMDAVGGLILLGLVTGSLVAFTGRIWPAVLVHVVYNGLGVGLTVVGTLFA